MPQRYFDTIQTVLDTYPEMLPRDGLKRLVQQALTEAGYAGECVDSIIVEVDEKARKARRRSGVVNARAPGQGGAHGLEKVVSSAGW